MNLSRGKCAFVLVGSMLLAACGGDDDKGGAGAFKTTVPGTKAVDKLTPTESTQLCRDFVAAGKVWMQQLAPGMCNFFAAIESGLGDVSQASCEASVKMCIAEVTKPEEETEMCGSIQNCTASVAQVTTCINDQIAVQKAFFDSVPTCAELAKGSSSGGGTAMLPVLPASCKAIETTCPSIATMGEDEDEEEEEEDLAD